MGEVSRGVLLLLSSVTCSLICLIPSGPSTEIILPALSTSRCTFSVTSTYCCFPFTSTNSTRCRVNDTVRFPSASGILLTLSTVSMTWRSFLFRNTLLLPPNTSITCARTSISDASVFAAFTIIAPLFPSASAAALVRNRPLIPSTPSTIKIPAIGLLGSTYLPFTMVPYKNVSVPKFPTVAESATAPCHTRATSSASSDIPTVLRAREFNSRSVIS